MPKPDPSAERADYKRDLDQYTRKLRGRAVDAAWGWFRPRAKSILTVGVNKGVNWILAKFGPVYGPIAIALITASGVTGVVAGEATNTFEPATLFKEVVIDNIVDVFVEEAPRENSERGITTPDSIGFRCNGQHMPIATWTNIVIDKHPDIDNALDFSGAIVARWEINGYRSSNSIWTDNEFYTLDISNLRSDGYTLDVEITASTTPWTVPQTDDIGFTAINVRGDHAVILPLFEGAAPCRIDLMVMTNFDVLGGDAVFTGMLVNAGVFDELDVGTDDGPSPNWVMGTSNKVGTLTQSFLSDNDRTKIR